MQLSKKRKSNLISFILTAIVIFALIKYLYENQGIFESLSKINVSSLFLLGVLYLVYILTLSFLNQRIFRKLAPNISTKSIIFLQFVNNLVNKILPKGGVAFRATYLKKHYQLSYSFFLASFASLMIVTFASQSLVSLFAMLIIFLKTGLYNLFIILAFVSILAGSITVIIIKPRPSKNRNWLFNYINKLIEGWKTIVGNTSDLLVFILISVAILLIDSLNMYVIFRTIKTPISYSSSLVLSSISLIMSYINITPDGLGVREGVYLYISSLVGLSEEQLLFGSLVQRTVSLVMACLFGGLSYIFLTKARRKTLENQSS